MYLKISLDKLLSMAPPGWDLMVKKRLPLKSESLNMYDKNHVQT
jgi:hypothetical protein